MNKLYMVLCLMSGGSVFGMFRKSSPPPPSLPSHTLAENPSNFFLSSLHGQTESFYKQIVGAHNAHNQKEVLSLLFGNDPRVRELKQEELGALRDTFAHDERSLGTWLTSKKIKIFKHQDLVSTVMGITGVASLIAGKSLTCSYADWERCVTFGTALVTMGGILKLIDPYQKKEKEYYMNLAIYCRIGLLLREQEMEATKQRASSAQEQRP